MNDPIPSPIPAWTKPPIPVSVQALREFVAKHGPDVSVLVTWTHETNNFQFVTAGINLRYANSAVNLRNILAGKLNLALGEITEDLRDQHPNVSLTQDELVVLTRALDRVNADDNLSPARRNSFEKHYLNLRKKFKDAYETKKPS